MRYAFTAALFCFLTFPLRAQTVGDPLPQRRSAIVRFPPTAFPELPKNVVTELNRRGCTIPQPYTDRRANVIRGVFATPGQTDWAVLCSVNGFSSILVFWNGSEQHPAVIAELPDEKFLIRESGGSGFARSIKAVETKTVAQHFRTDGSPERPRIAHDGVLDESFAGKPSIVHYHHSGKWLRSCPEPKIQY
jgi:hypothetical protein